MAEITPLKRTAIIVRDMPRSLSFYKDALGMTVWSEGRAGEEIPALYELLGMPPCNTHWVILRSTDSDWGMVGLFELSDPVPDDDRHPNIDRVNRGETCLVFECLDIEAIHRQARELGLTVLCPPTLLELPQQGTVSREMTLRDPNGVLVNFIQRM
ncbi:MAG: VOC family protein [Steroidobacteraceae bacterium]